MTLLHATIVAALLFAIPAFAQTPTQPQTQDHQQHHPGTPPGARGQPSQPAMSQPQQPGKGSGMMGGGMMGQGMMGPGMMHGMGQGGSMMGANMMQGGLQGRGMASAASIDRVEGRLAFLKTELKITDAQQPLWNRFADAVRTNAQTRNAEMQAMHGRVGADVSLPDRVLAQANAFTAHAEEMTRLKAALDPLYASLTAEQKKVADEIVFSPMGVPSGMM